ncbi:MAG: LysE family transporter [Opitutus sp.]
MPLTSYSLFQGLVIGFSIAAPVGPIGLLCIRRSMTNGRLVGFVSGLGAATADAGYGVIAVSGLSFVTRLLLDQRIWIQGLGGGFLFYLGLSMMRAQPPANRAVQPSDGASLAGAFTSTFLLTLSNPATILSFIAIFAGLGVIGSGASGNTAAALLVVGVFLGSATWWLLLSGIAGWLGGKATPRQLRLINVLAGALVLALGLWQLVSLVRSVPAAA